MSHPINREDIGNLTSKAQEKVPVPIVLVSDHNELVTFRFEFYPLPHVLHAIEIANYVSDYLVDSHQVEEMPIKYSATAYK
jgi:hypothetical protein